MSVIVRDESGQIKVLTKGADSVLSQMLGPLDMDTLSGRLQNAIRENTAVALQEHATEGLRTLLICEKVISEGAYEDWLAKYKQALNSTGDGKKRKIEKAAAMVESDLNVLGSTAVQDNLQEGVPEALQSFKQAGINVWMLTGDKEETAINIGFACGMITNET
jgi:P-type E1-E2 ATPase